MNQQVFIVNIMNRELKPVFLPMAEDDDKQIITMARSFGQVVGHVNDDMIIRVVADKSLALRLGSQKFSGALFVIASSKDVISANSLHLKLFRQISYQINVARPIIVLMKRDCYSLDEVVKVSPIKSISIRDFIKQMTSTSVLKQQAMFKCLYSCNADYGGDPDYTVKTLIKSFSS